jgi:midasin (ATPase involved in ribosome maturation)
MSEKSLGKTGRRSGGGSAAARVEWDLVERVLASEMLRCIYLHGPPGIGKTYCAYHKGRLGRGCWSLALTPETPASELRGHYLPRGDAWLWHDGPVIQAMRAGGRIVLNEPAHASDDVLAFLHPVLESPATARLGLPTGETVVPAEGFHVVLCDNSPPDELPPALRDRFDAVLEIREPHPEALALLSDPLREAARRTFALEPERRVSLRGWLVLERLRLEFGLALACLVLFGAERGSQIHDAIVLAGGR